MLALEAARRGRRAVVVTIDPARRLADALGLEGLTNDARRASTGDWPGRALGADARHQEHLRRPRAPSYAADPEQAERILDNRFYRNISGALSGTQEYMAMEKLYELHEEGDFDLVVVDTPPTRNALDFLDAPRRLTRFLDHRLYQVLMTPTRGLVRAVNVAAQALPAHRGQGGRRRGHRRRHRVLPGLRGHGGGLPERAATVDELLSDDRHRVRAGGVAPADTVAEAAYFADKLAERGIEVRGPHRQPDAPRSVRTGAPSPTAAEAARERARTLAGTALGDLYTCLADARQLARGEEEHLAGLADRVAPAPVVRVPVQPFEVSDLGSLAALARLMFDSGAAEGPG